MEARREHDAKLGLAPRLKLAPLEQLVWPLRGDQLAAVAADVRQRAEGVKLGLEDKVRMVELFRNAEEPHEGDRRHEDRVNFTRTILCALFLRQYAWDYRRGSPFPSVLGEPFLRELLYGFSAPQESP